MKMIWVLLLFVSVAQAETLDGYVVAISDGDTITVLDAKRQQYKIRLAGIDAPEKAQAFGERSKQHLAELVFNKLVTVEWDKFDRYSRTIGKVLVNGTDANLEQIKAGMAWWYEKYKKEQSTDDQRDYRVAEQQAKIEHRIHKLAEEGYAVIYITEKAAALVPDTIAVYATKTFPAIIPIPASTGNLGIGMKQLKGNVEKAVGADILFKEG